MDNESVEVVSAKELALNLVKLLIDNNKADNSRLLFSSMAIFKQDGCSKALKPRLSSNELFNGYHIREDMYGIFSMISKIEAEEAKLDPSKPFNIRYIINLKRNGIETSKEISMWYYSNLGNDIKAMAIPAVEKFMELNNE